MILKSISIIKAPKILPKIKDFEVFVARWVVDSQRSPERSAYAWFLFQSQSCQPSLSFVVVNQAISAWSF